jgi:hypothetical protein
MFVPAISCFTEIDLTYSHAGQEAQPTIYNVDSQDVCEKLLQVYIRLPFLIEHERLNAFRRIHLVSFKHSHPASLAADFN